MASHPIYQFYTELNDYEPKIWRRIQVPGHITVARLGYIVMTLYEMEASHLFCIQKEFRPYHEPVTYEVPNEYGDGEEAKDATTEKMHSLIYRVGDQLTMLYDYGDGWEVTLTFEKVFEDKELPGRELPRVLEGEGYGIIEDCGGVGGLEEIAKAYAAKSGSRYAEYCEWLGEAELDLTAFDRDDMNLRLKKIPRIYQDLYEYDLMPTKQSTDFLKRRYKNR